MSTRAPRIENRKARFDYEILQQLEAGICLNGGEVKSIRAGGCSLAGSYVSFSHGEAFLHGAHVNPYDKGDGKEDPLRLRKLLLNKREIEKLAGASSQRGLTVVPLALYFNKRGIVKLDIALVKGKQLHDKRASLRDKDEERGRRREAAERD